ncbi:MAG: SRPBCC domain-containing protein [Thermoanaerobaculia bacterium]
MARGRRPARATGGALLVRVLYVLLTLTALLVLGALFLSTGSEVSCTEAQRAEEPRLRCEFDVATAPETVWEAFTRTDSPRPHYFDAVLEAELRPGGRWRFVTDNRERLLAGGEILALEPPRRFVQSFTAADLDDPPSRITVELAPTADGTRVLLLHDGFERRTATYRRFRRAHPLALSALKSLVETGRLPLRARLYTSIFEPAMKLATVPAEPWH